MTKVRVDSKAAEEVTEAAVWYEMESPGLGFGLLDAFEHALELLADELSPLSAMAGAAASLGAKRLILHRFPFSVVVLERTDEIFVVAFAHHSRRPGYWADRIDT